MDQIEQKIIQIIDEKKDESRSPKSKLEIRLQTILIRKTIPKMNLPLRIFPVRILMVILLTKVCFPKMQ